MGRELKRVPLDFKWRIGRVWKGYVNPYPFCKCKECDGSGYSAAFQNYDDKWYGWNVEAWEPNPFRQGWRYNTLAWSNNLNDEDVKALLDAGRLIDFTRVALTDEHRDIIKKQRASGGGGWLPFDNGYIPTAKEVNEWNLKGMGHDSINKYFVIKAKLEKEGRSHLCSKCNGSGEFWETEASEELYNGWKEFDPPIGEGFQLWETTSEGSPKSPVFKTLELLCEWCEDGATVFGSDKTTKEDWFKMLSGGLVYSESGNCVFI